MAMLHLINRSD